MISTALRTGTPLPQITPCPLLDRFVANQHAFIAARGDAEPDYNIPRNLTLETLENEQYLYVAVRQLFQPAKRFDYLEQVFQCRCGHCFRHRHSFGQAHASYERASGGTVPYPRNSQLLAKQTLREDASLTPPA